jgi:hypothetical protein
MQFTQLKSEIKSVGFVQIREESEDYFEAVLVKNNLTELISRLNKFFGSPTLPSDKPLSVQARAVIADFGDIMAGQTLYFWNEARDAIFVMLWPWGDKERITLKMGQAIISSA